MWEKKFICGKFSWFFPRIKASHIYCSGKIAANNFNIAGPIDTKFALGSEILKIRAQMFLNDLLVMQWIWIIFFRLDFLITLSREGGPGSKISLVYIKVQPVMKLLLFTESQNLRLWRIYGATKFGAIAQSHTKYRRLKWPKTAIFEQYFQK